MYPSGLCQQKNRSPSVHHLGDVFEKKGFPPRGDDSDEYGEPVTTGI